MNLTISYLTCRKNPMLEWFFSSLANEVRPPDDIRIVIVDFYNRDWLDKINVAFATLGAPHPIRWIRSLPPKPTVWQGKYKLTKSDYFAAANARNTAICFAHDGWISFVDDLSVLMPGWLNAVREAMEKNYIVCGAFRKVNKLVVENGEVKSFEDHAPGHDSRWKHGNDTKAVLCPPNWLFGCSLAAPVDAFLKINGWPEMCDSTGIGLEDCLTGAALSATGHKLKYDRRMYTLESEELHHVGTPLLRMDKNRGKTVEVSPGVKHPDEKGHALVKRLSGATRFDNDFGPFPDLAALRQHVLNGGAFPIVNRPTVDFYDSQPLSEL